MSFAHVNVCKDLCTYLGKTEREKEREREREVIYVCMYVCIHVRIYIYILYVNAYFFPISDLIFSVFDWQNRVRDLKAGYKQSLSTLELAKQISPELVTKSR